MASLASINIKFTADLKQFSSQMDNVKRSLSKTGKQLQNIGAGLTLGVTTPLLTMGGVAVATAAKLETLKTSLNTVFEGNSAAADSAFDKITKFASTTPYQVEEVATAFIKLKNLGLDPSISSLTSYGNTASALGKSLDQMIEAVADASVGEFERLKEFGIKAKSEGENVSFTFQGVTTTVKKSSEDIQQYLLNIGDTNFAGSIERQAQTFNGKMSTLRDNMSQAFAGIGIIIIDYINPLFEKINGLLVKFNELSPTTKKWIVILGGVAAAIGPLLALSGTILPAIGTGLTLLTGPIGLLIAGLTTIGVIIYKNWKPIKQTLIDIANYFVDLYNESMVFRIGVESIIGVFKTFFEVGKFAFEALKSLLSAFVDNFTNGFKTIGKLIKAVFTGNLDEIPGIIKEAAGKGVDNFKNFTENIGNDWDGLMAGMKDVANETLDNITTRKKLKYFGENVDASAITDKVAEATEQGLINGTVNVGTITSGKINPNALTLDDEEALSVDPLEGLEQLIIDGGERIRDAVNEAGFNSMISDAVAIDLESLNEKTDEAVTAYEERLKALETIGRATGDAVGGAFTSLSGNIVESMKLADHGLQGFVKSLIQGVTKIIATLLSQSIASAIAGGSSAGAATGPGAVAAIPAFIASLVATVIGAFASIPKFETGGVVAGSSFYGDKILARVNSGELILNQRQQKSVFESMNKPNDTLNLIGEWKLRGEDLITVIDRSTKSQNRRS